MKTLLRKILKILLWTAAAWLLLIIAAEIVMSSSILTKTVNRIGTEYVDGELGFGKVSLSMFRKFPNATLTMEDFSVTYPSDRFDSAEKKGPQGHLLYRGCGETADTLASFRRFSVSLNPWALITGKISIPEVELIHPRIFAHAYHDGSANWNIFRSDTTKAEDTVKTGMELPKIEIGKIRLTKRPHIVFTDSRDTIFAMIDLHRMGFDGRLSTGKASRNRIGLTIDSMFVAGRISADTLALGLDKLHIHEHNRHMDFNARAKTLAATRSFGRIHIPLSLGGTIHFPQDTVPSLAVRNFKAEIASVPMQGEVTLRKLEGRTGIDGRLSINGCKVDEVIRSFIRNFIPEAGKVSTDAIISMDAVCSDEYVHGSDMLPKFEIGIKIPESSFSHKDIDAKVRLAAHAGAVSDGHGTLSAYFDSLSVKSSGIDLRAAISLSDILAKDPLIRIDGALDADLQKMSGLLPEDSRVTADGHLMADIKGKARMSHLSLYTFSQSDLSGQITGDDLTFSSPDDSIDIRIDGMSIRISPETMTSRRDTSKNYRLAGISGQIMKADISYKDSTNLSGQGLTFSAKSSTDSGTIDSTTVNRLGGRLGADKLLLTDASGTSIQLDNTVNGFQMIPKRDNPAVPVITLTSTNNRITLITDVNRAILTDASIKARGAMNSIERKVQRKARLDSLQAIYPDIPRDSLFRHAMNNRPAAETPAWMKEEDFRKKDIDIRLDQSLATYFREWDLNGKIDIRTGILMTPYFPLRNILRGCEISFDNNRIGIDSLKVMSGKSNIMAKGELTGLRRALAGRGRSLAIMNLKMALSTDRMNANELLTAYSQGSRFNPAETRDAMAEATNAEFLKMVVTDTVSADRPAKLFVIPANLNADISIDGKDIRYSDLDISDFKASLKMKERCVQITNTSAVSNIGDVSFEGFYATRTKKDIRTGFNFSFKDITAEKAIAMMPAVDTIMPLLKSFAGKINCEIAATSRLDTNMNILTPTINGILRISGYDLSIKDSDIFTSLAKKLHFNNSKVGNIQHMTVEGVIQDNVLEVFPFVLSLDRYTLALSGKQNLDMSYKYHASVIRSPMLLKVGVDIYGKDFDNMKFKIGKAKYKNEKVPVFSAVIDQTRINLAESIRNIFEKGVETAVKENEKQAAISELRQEIGYVSAVDQELESLSEEEQKQLDEAESSSEEVMSETETETTNNKQDE